jgi:hypothetical protein
MTWMVFMLPVAAASEPFDQYALRPGEPNLIDTPLEEVLRRSAVVIEGMVLEERVVTWLGPADTTSFLVWRVRVDEELLGHVESGVVDVAVISPFPPTADYGDRVLLVGAPMVLAMPTHLSADVLKLPWPGYADVLVPTVPGGLYQATTATMEDEGPVLVTSQWTRRGDEKWFHPTDWNALVVAARRDIQSTPCHGCGATIPGVVVEAAP